MRLAVAGGGYVGLATAVGFARLGHQVDLIEIDPARGALLRGGLLPFGEPGIQAALPAVLDNGLVVHTSYPPALDVDAAFVCTGTDARGDGRLDETEVEAAIEALAAATEASTPIVIRSTLNPGSTLRWQRRLSRRSPRPLAANPEFLREGYALEDFERPARRVIGALDARTTRMLTELYDFSDSPLLLMDPTSAELCKLASNAALALRVSMANEIALTALAVGADPDLVLRGVGSDSRIGLEYLQPGAGFGGYCLPKDLDAFCNVRDATALTSSVFAAARGVNAQLIDRLAGRILDLLGESPNPLVALHGVAFKAGSDSIRGSRGVELARRLDAHGVRVGVCDAGIRWEQQQESSSWARLWPSPATAAEECDVLVLLHRVDPAGLCGRRAVVLDALGRTLQPAVSAK